MKKNLFIFLAAVALVGCEYETIPTNDYASTNSPPSRFKVVSSVYYHTDPRTPNFALTELVDTKGTNNILVIQSEHGIQMMYIPKAIETVEDWKTK